MIKTVVGAFVLIAGVMSFGAPASDKEPIKDTDELASWVTHGRTSSELYFSPLRMINADNVRQLGLAWFLDLPGERTLEATPLAIDGTLYFSGTYGRVFAVDAVTGKLLWKFDPDSGSYRPDIFRYSGSLGGNRGVAYWRGRVYVGAVDGRLFSLHAKTGAVSWSVQTFDDPKARKGISGAPRVFNGTVIIGHNGDPGARGCVSAYDAKTGKLRWRFFTVPGDPRNGFENAAMAMAAKTWKGKWWTSGGNGSVWDSILYDRELNRIYVGTANWTSPDGASLIPRSDNLFVSSIIALDAETGRYVWHYQENPGGGWDYDANAPMMLTDLAIDGVSRKVLLHAPKNGFFYVIDRTTGKLISAEKFAKATWAERIDRESGRPVEAHDAMTQREPAVMWPSFLGAHNWQPMSFNPQTGLVYIPTMKIGMRYENGIVAIERRESDDGTAALLAWDPVRQRARWKVHHPDSFWNGGTMTTGGDLVFQGTARGQFIAYRASTGERLWTFDAGLGIIAAPTSYEVGGTQYIAVLVGYGAAGILMGKLADYGWRFNEQPRRLLTFALGNTTPLPPANRPRYDVQAVDDPELHIDIEEANQGRRLYLKYWCAVCHGMDLENTGSFAPDLRESALGRSWDGFRRVVRDGALAQMGMPKFAELSDKELRSLYLYVRQRARQAAHASSQH